MRLVRETLVRLAGGSRGVKDCGMVHSSVEVPPSIGLLLLTYSHCNTRGMLNLRATIFAHKPCPSTRLVDDLVADMVSRAVCVLTTMSLSCHPGATDAKDNRHT